MARPCTTPVAIAGWQVRGLSRRGRTVRVPPTSTSLPPTEAASTVSSTRRMTASPCSSRTGPASSSRATAVATGTFGSWLSTDGRPTGEPRLVWREVGAFGQVERFTRHRESRFLLRRERLGNLHGPAGSQCGGRIDRRAHAPRPDEQRVEQRCSVLAGRAIPGAFPSQCARLVIRELATGLEREIPFGAQLSQVMRAPTGVRAATLSLRRDTSTEVGEVAYRVNLKDASVQRLSIGHKGTSAAVCRGWTGDHLHPPE